jgi:hypothetical protein
VDASKSDASNRDSKGFPNELSVERPLVSGVAEGTRNWNPRLALALLMGYFILLLLLGQRVF